MSGAAFVARRRPFNWTPASPPVYEGDYPTKYRVTQHVAQWTPSLIRTSRIGPVSAGLRANWDTIDASTDVREIKQKLFGDQPFEGTIFRMHGMERLLSVEGRIPR